MATIVLNIYFLLLASFLCGRCEVVLAQNITPGSSLFPTVQPSSWRSPSGRFAFGFYQQGDGFEVGIWLFGDSTNTTVWTANPEDPPISSNAMLKLTKNGELLLQTGPGQTKRIAHTDNGVVSFALMRDSGNFVLQDNTSTILWQSFDYPTDTMLGGQILPSGSSLLSSSSENNQSSSRFQLTLMNNGRLSLFPRYSDHSIIWDSYWASDNKEVTGSNYTLFLNNTGPPFLCIVNASNPQMNTIWSPGIDGLSSRSNFSGNNTIYRATLHSNGVFRLYAHFDDDNGKHQYKQLWSSPELENPCNVKTYCGFNSYCTFNDNQPYCNCLPGTDFIDQSRHNLGCKRNFSKAECRDGKDNESFYNMSTMPSMTMGDLRYIEEDISEEECPSSCWKDCYCGASTYKVNRCWKYKLPFMYVSRTSQGSSASNTIYFKVGYHSLKSNNDRPKPPIKTTSKKAIVQIILLISGFAILLCSLVSISGHLIFKIGVLSYKRMLEMGDLGLNEGVTLRVFSYNELKKATNGFKQGLGKGSFGSVYKGTLQKRRKLIAVKRLEKLVEEGEREFQGEMKAIGKTHHKNLVRLLGYCAEESKRLLVYEYMNGSLEKFIFGDSTTRPNWDQRRKIALDIARGLLYLHEECEAPIIHCDIKPHNILMDEFWTAKISDFGLAKLLMPDQTRTFTQVRGTRGYVAPEWSKNTPITVKADIYSYGIMLLEIVFCRRNIAVNLSHPEQSLLSNWVYECFVGRELHRLVLGEEVDHTLLENMVKVGLWCIQDEPFLRPSMKSVVLMLEGVAVVAIPPCPTAN